MPATSEVTPVVPVPLVTVLPLPVVVLLAALLTTVLPCRICTMNWSKALARPLAPSAFCTVKVGDCVTSIMLTSNKTKLC